MRVQLERTDPACCRPLPAVCAAKHPCGISSAPGTVGIRYRHASARGSHGRFKNHGTSVRESLELISWKLKVTLPQRSFLESSTHSVKLLLPLKGCSFVPLSVWLDIFPLSLVFVAGRRSRDSPVDVENWSNLLWVLEMIPCCIWVAWIFKNSIFKDALSELLRIIFPSLPLSLLLALSLFLFPSLSKNQHNLDQMPWVEFNLVC